MKRVIVHMICHFINLDWAISRTVKHTIMLAKYKDIMCVVKSNTRVAAPICLNQDIQWLTQQIPNIFSDDITTYVSIRKFLCEVVGGYYYYFNVTNILIFLQQSSVIFKGRWINMEFNLVSYLAKYFTHVYKANHVRP